MAVCRALCLFFGLFLLFLKKLAQNIFYRRSYSLALLLRIVFQFLKDFSVNIVVDISAVFFRSWHNSSFVPISTTSANPHKTGTFQKSKDN